MRWSRRKVRTAIFAPVPEFVTVLQISDPHLRAVADPAQGSPDSGLRQLVELLASEQPEVVLLTGDVADDGSLAAYERAQYMVAGLGAAVLATPGNHDDPAALAEVFGRAKALDIGGWRLLCVNTFVPGEQFGKIDVETPVFTMEKLLLPAAASGEPRV